MSHERVVFVIVSLSCICDERLAPVNAEQVFARLHGSGAQMEQQFAAVYQGGAVASPGYGAATAAPRRGDPAVAGQDHDVEAEQLGHGEQ